MCNLEKSKQICNICKESKYFSEYNKNKSRKSGYSTVCRDCSKQVSKNYYKNNRDVHLSNVKDRKERIRCENKKLIVDYLEKNPCVDCKEGDIRTLQFDHKFLEDKSDDISKMLANGIVWDSIKKEIDKCEVRCANCHSKRTSKQFNWYKEEYV